MLFSGRLAFFRCNRITKNVFLRDRLKSARLLLHLPKRLPCSQFRLRLRCRLYRRCCAVKCLLRFIRRVQAHINRRLKRLGRRCWVLPRGGLAAFFAPVLPPLLRNTANVFSGIRYAIHRATTEYAILDRTASAVILANCTQPLFVIVRAVCFFVHLSQMLGGCDGLLPGVITVKAVLLGRCFRDLIASAHTCRRFGVDVAAGFLHPHGLHQRTRHFETVSYYIVPLIKTDFAVIVGHWRSFRLWRDFLWRLSVHSYCSSFFKSLSFAVPPCAPCPRR